MRHAERPITCAARTIPRLRRLGLVVLISVASLPLLAASGATAPTAATAGGLVEVVVTLPQPPLAEAILHDRALAAATTKRHRLDLRTPASVSYLRTLASAQRELQARVEAAIPQARVRWHYGVVLNGVAVVVPQSQLARLEAMPGAIVWPTLTYHALLNRTPTLIGAPTVWGSTLSTAGNGIKIGILDDGIDQTHVFFDPSNFTYPAGFPKGDTGFTTPKVIVARTFAPPEPVWKNASKPFDPVYSDHATNVAGIAAGDNGTLATVQGTRYRVSGIAPNAYLGNYKVLTIPTADFGLDGNSPEIAAGIEQAVKDGMDVINLSLGEPEVNPARDVVVQAIDDAADAGVVPVIAAGNDFAEAGRGSVGSPGTAPKAIAVGASTEGDVGPADEIADFSSSGPTPVSLLFKPDVTAPGVDILSSLPGNAWSAHDWSGTSMASPHVAGAAALLRERHPSWTVEQIKSALESTGDPVHATGSTTEVGVLREGGGRIDLPRADNPLVFTDPTSLSFGLVKAGMTATQQLATADAGGGPAQWTVSVQAQSGPAGAMLSSGTPTLVAGSSVALTLSVAAGTGEGDAGGFVLLTRGTDVRRIPYWFRVEAPKLGTEPHRTITKPGVYRGDTAGKPSLVSSYRYPDGNLVQGVPNEFAGPEQVFRFVVTGPIANFGVVVLSHTAGVTPRLVVAGDENRLVGYTGLPVDLNPYSNFGRLEPVVGDVLPAPGAYDLVFETAVGAVPGPFTFRFWVNDTTPPRVRLVTPSVRRGRMLQLSVTDSGSGADPASFTAHVDGSAKATIASVQGSWVLLATNAIAPGTHTLTFVASDYQETKNMEDVGRILPNTTTFRTTFLVRR